MPPLKELSGLLITVSTYPDIDETVTSSVSFTRQEVARPLLMSYREPNPHFLKVDRIKREIVIMYNLGGW